VFDLTRPTVSHSTQETIHLNKAIKSTGRSKYFIKIYDILLPTAINGDKADPNYSKTIRDKT